MICIYHSRDLDGFTSGAIVKHKYPDCKLIGYDYGEEFPKIPECEEIIMIDVSLKMEQMKLLSKSNKFTWIDHHISPINEYRSQNWKCNDVLANGISACEIGYNYLFPNKKQPIAVGLLGEYDTWRNNGTERWNNIILPFQMGMRLLCNSPETFPLSLLDSENEDLFLIDKIIENGKIIMKYQSVQNEIAIKGKAFEYVIGDIKCICCNGGGGSILFDSIWNPNKYDIMLTFSFCKDKWIFSLYTTHENIDCSLIAKSFGGGGHKKASGFEMKNLSILGL